MTEPTYHKIDSVFKRDPQTRHRTFLMGEWARPEFGYLSDLTWEGTEKVDGTNVRIHLSEHGVSIGGRTDRADLPKPLTEHVAEVAEAARRVIDDALTLYGEGYGAKIQKGGGNYRADQGFILFDAMTPDGMFLRREDVEDIAGKVGIPFAPVIFRGSLWDAVEELQDPRCVPLSRVAVTATPIEGFVLRPRVELRDRRGARVITKLKAKDFAA
jgi:hypothetical protein